MPCRRTSQWMALAIGNSMAPPAPRAPRPVRLCARSACMLVAPASVTATDPTIAGAISRLQCWPSTFTHASTLRATLSRSTVHAQDVHAAIDAMNQSALAALDELLTPVPNAPDPQPTPTPVHSLMPMSAGNSQRTPVPLTVFAVRATPSPAGMGEPAGWSPSWATSAAGEAFLSHGMRPSQTTSDDK